MQKQLFETLPEELIKDQIFQTYYAIKSVLDVVLTYSFKVSDKSYGEKEQTF